MSLPVDYDSMVGEAEAELAIRQALADCFLVAGVNFGFLPELVHTRPRFPNTDEKYILIATIIDPDTEAAAAEAQTRLVRYFSAKLVGFSRSLFELTLRYETLISFGFKDEYAATSLVGQNSYNEQIACAMQYQKILADNLNLGLDDRVTHKYLDLSSEPEFMPVDKQGNAAYFMKGRIQVVLNVC